MIHIQDKSQCCGCEACVQRCPVHCISMRADEEGFMYPEVDSSLCIQCGLCEKVCPVIGRSESREPISVWAAWNKNDEIRRQSSSGGIFTAIAESVIGRGGIVFGARFDDNWNVIHDSTETLEGLAAFRGSKYVQSRIGDCYIRAEQFLKQGRTVLFTGTPCQIAGLHGFLQKDYPNLLTADIICHGVPSPGVWQQYINEEIQNYSRKCNRKFLFFPSSIRGRGYKIENISFRDKVTGWKKFSVSIVFSLIDSQGEYHKTRLCSPYSNNKFMLGFLSNLYLRPICYKCPIKNFRSQSDITIGDYWGVQQEITGIDDDKGISAIIVNNVQGLEIIQQLDEIKMLQTTYNKVLMYNPVLEHSVEEHKNRLPFYRDNSDFRKKINKYLIRKSYFVNCLYKMMFKNHER